ncbi:uncharacterized protein LOC118648078 [Monomorium pharaonis]|uniref:uncharacterized protein LOC105840421 n=1 Tax=Monomorium pharaonis TaxID=307658 RepID=UPI0017469CA8|nr:uncharacterized protein LOC105840421 [Monomorium pharaonis]XP_036150189.1 uncharacterized protein LOC118648078 [Monomorium pharaonis]
MPLMRDNEMLVQPLEPQQVAVASTMAGQSVPLIHGAEVNRVGMRMPEFTPNDPELWFSILDRSFHAAGITTDATKFGYALTALGPTYMAEVRDVIMNPPGEGAYDTLKRELTKRLSLSQEHKTRRLLEHEEIGDRKPSQFLRHLRSLAGAAVGDSVLRTVWLSRLPSYLQPHLVARATDTLDQLADIADAIAGAVRAPALQIAEAATPSVTRVIETDGAAAFQAKINLQLTQMRLSLQQEMTEQIAALRRSIEAIGQPERGRGEFRGRQRSRSRSRGRGHASNNLCWYHWRFGPDARRCDPPCAESSARGNAAADR